LYESIIRPNVERDHFGKFLVLDTDSGEYEIDADHLAAAKHPDAPLFANRIGYRAMGRIGWRRTAASQGAITDESPARRIDHG